jgi:hypothetical protein
VVTAPAHLVPYRDRGLVIALQYWQGDMARAFRLARLIADIEPRYRNDVTLVLTAFDVEPARARDVVLHCNAKMRTFARATWRATTLGHPDASNALWLGTMELLTEMWRAGDLDHHDVFTVEADGCPLDADWINRIKAEHATTHALGLRVTGALMPRPQPHINGSLVMSIPWFFNHPSLGVTPPGEAWDVYHRDEILAAARPSAEIRNIYGATEWTASQLAPLGKQAAWLSSTKDSSAIEWAERALPGTPTRGE